MGCATSKAVEVVEFESVGEEIWNVRMAHMERVSKKESALAQLKADYIIAMKTIRMLEELPEEEDVEKALKRVEHINALREVARRAEMCLSFA
jgi:hypothetical protein